MENNFIVGYGCATEDFSIVEREFAAFENDKDAQEFVRMKYYNGMWSDRIFYVQETGKDRLIFVPEKNSFFKGEEIFSGKEAIKIPVYQVTAVEEWNDENGYDFRSEEKLCLSMTTAEKIQSGYAADGFTDITIDETEVDIMFFWNASVFVKGAKRPNEKTKTEEVRMHYRNMEREER